MKAKARQRTIDQINMSATDEALFYVSYLTYCKSVFLYILLRKTSFHTNKAAILVAYKNIIIPACKVLC